MGNQSSKQVPDDRNPLTEGIPLTNKLHSNIAYFSLLSH